MKNVKEEILESTNSTQWVVHWKKEAEVKRIILDFMKDHFISHILYKKRSKKMFDALVKLFHNSCAS